MNIKFDDKVAIVTGAGGGIGKQHALELAKRGAKVVVNDLGGSVDGSGTSDAAEQVVDEIISSGGTHKHIIELGFKAIEISEFTNHPEMMNGRVKTLHPKIFGGILESKTKDHQRELKDKKIINFDLVIVNIYPFEKTIKILCDAQTSEL